MQRAAKALQELRAQLSQLQGELRNKEGDVKALQVGGQGGLLCCMFLPWCGCMKVLLL